jgi:hypothetical protein
MKDRPIPAAALDPSTPPTLGPWVYHPERGDIIAPSVKKEDARMSDDIWNYYGGELVAETVCACDGPLLAAAQELLHALTMVRDADDDCGRDELARIPAAARAVIDSAIAQATGKARP